jgi:hypothetical protein
MNQLAPYCWRILTASRVIPSSNSSTYVVSRAMAARLPCISGGDGRHERVTLATRECCCRCSCKVMAAAAVIAPAAKAKSQAKVKHRCACATAPAWLLPTLSSRHPRSSGEVAAANDATICLYSNDAAEPSDGRVLQPTGAPMATVPCGAHVHAAKMAYEKEHRANTTNAPAHGAAIGATIH